VICTQQHTEHIVAFPPQQWLREPANTLRCTYRLCC